MSADSKAIALLIGITVLAGLLLYLPFFLWFKWQRRRNRHEIRTETRPTKVGWFICMLEVCVMFGGLAVAKLAPSSRVGSALQGIGEWYFFAYVILAGAIVDAAFRLAGFPSSYRKVVLPKPKNASASAL
jgi:hypothetical protein